MTSNIELTGRKPAREWLPVLAAYREPSFTRSVAEIAVTVIPFLVLWGLSWWLSSISHLLALPTMLLAGLFLVRVFLIQHDCGHGSFFETRRANDIVGRVLGVLTLTPYGDWKHSHAMHHATSGNLDRRGFGDITTLTVREYRSRSPFRRFIYRLYRTPVVLFGVGPAFVFLLRNRVPANMFRCGWKPWAGVLANNLALAVVYGTLFWLMGWKTFLLVHIPIVLIAATVGIWLFYVQHQFETTTWEYTPDWTVQDAALYGSSHYDLPGPLKWMTANIGIHHIHHLSSRIPFYRLQDVISDHPELADVQRLTLAESLNCLRLRLWDESSKRLVTFREAAALPA